MGEPSEFQRSDHFVSFLARIKKARVFFFSSKWSRSNRKVRTPMTWIFFFIFILPSSTSFTFGINRSSRLSFNLGFRVIKSRHVTFRGFKSGISFPLTLDNYYKELEIRWIIVPGKNRFENNNPDTDIRANPRERVFTINRVMTDNVDYVI